MSWPSKGTLVRARLPLPGVGEGLGITTPIVSPTFTIIREYAGRLPYYHFDVYRLEGIEELDDLGFEEYFYGDGVVVIEWANLIDRSCRRTIWRSPSLWRRH